MLVSLVKIKPSGVCIFREYAKKKLQSSSSNLKDLCPADDTCITNGTRSFHQLLNNKDNARSYNPNASFTIINTEPNIFIV